MLLDQWFSKFKLYISLQNFAISQKFMTKIFWENFLFVIRKKNFFLVFVLMWNTMILDYLQAAETSFR